jgi:hypothetical protein
MDKNEIIIDFFGVVDRVYGLYLDACMGFSQNIEVLGKVQQQFVQQGMTIEQLDKLPFTFGMGEPDENPNIQHECTQSELKQRNAKNGANAFFMANMCLVSIYHYWDEEFRNRLADVMEIKHKEVQSDIMGDIRLIRNIIIHKKGISDKPKDNFKIIDFIEEGDLIRITELQMNCIIKSIYTKPVN